MKKALIVLFLLAMLVTSPVTAQCERCVVFEGGDGAAHCMDPSITVDTYPLVAPCHATVHCFRFYNGVRCQPACDGEWCYEV
jgi:hypothetical protein